MNQETTAKFSSINSIKNEIKKISGSLSKSHSDLRFCSRCHKALTDPASWERGIGPECAKKDTHLFAKTIPANYMMAVLCCEQVECAELIECVRDIFSSLKSLIELKSSKSISKCESVTTFMHAGEDLREFVKIIDWLLSFETPSKEKELMIKVVEHLGFPSLASVLEGNASTGKSSISFDSTTGKLSLVGSSNKAGFKAMLKIPGTTVPRYRGDKKPFLVRAEHHEQFFNNVLKYWPCFEENIDTVKEQTLDWLKKNQIKQPQQEQHTTKQEKTAAIKNNEKSSPSSVVEVFPNGNFSVSFEWSKTAPQVVNSIKEIFWKQRSYNPATKMWTIFDPTKLIFVEQLLKNQGYLLEKKTA